MGSKLSAPSSGASVCLSPSLRPRTPANGRPASTGPNRWHRAPCPSPQTYPTILVPPAWGGDDHYASAGQASSVTFERSAAPGAGRCYNRLMHEPWDTAGKPSHYDKGRLRSCGGGCLLAGAILFLFLLVFGFGLGLPYTYWLPIAEVQTIPGQERLGLVIGAERTIGSAEGP